MFISNWSLNILQKIKKKMLQEDFQLYKYKLFDIFKCLNYKHFSSIDKKRKRRVWKYKWNFEHLVKKKE